MRPGIFKLMQMIGAYRKTDLTQPNPTPDEVESKIATLQGTNPTQSRPEDQPYTIWECQCELDLDQFIPAKSRFKGEGIPLPYVVSIDKDAETGLSIRRDWYEEDEWCTRIRMYVRYPYIPGPGFYGTGMLGVVGNSSAAMTAAWREALNAGMMANFPGGFISKKAVRGKDGGNPNTTFTMGPGEFAPIETGDMPIAQVVTGMPYKDITAGLLTLMDKITEQSKSAGQSAEVPAAEGIANVPVGSMLAQIEQATKVMAAAHKGMHQAQSEEIQMISDLFRRHPDDLIKSDGDSPIADWSSDQLIQALTNTKLVPVSDPNVPSHIHRVAKALGLVQLAQMPMFGARLDMDEVLRRVLAAMREDPIGLQKQAQEQPDPKMIDAMSKAKKIDADIQTKPMENALKMQELQSDQTIHQMDLQKEQIIHQHDAEKSALEVQKVHADVAVKQGGLEQAEIDSKRKAGLGLVEAGLKAHQMHQDHALGVAEHQANVQQADQQHALGVHQANQQHEQASQQHGLGVAEHGRESTKDANQAMLGATDAETKRKVAEKPATPAKPKAKK